MSGAPNSGQDATQVQAALEAFPNVLKKIQGLWATRGCDTYFQGLFMDTRGGTRRGFPMEVGEELLFLVRFNKNVRALPLAAELNVSLEEAYRLIDKGDQESLASGGNGWGDPRSATETFAHARPQSTPRDFLNYKVVPPPKKKKSGALTWIIMIVLLALVYKLLYPVFTGG
ncbi:protein of unknown function [Sterolibacterium denitrificans]|uniref:Uncharacterized protein n=2 Tax=Sterolibacterium denitrificans TaxID=157592 RepID=A0A7Z7HP05_9PROT|nr:hypothetical protein [Sterolibacterium denitrificans]KYC28838.1 hypothetical protein ACY05_03925 [Sterolibacterium denitrificans]SMB21180.1 protein of unknown function [Sterolibacterium denitrificans]